jgi:hypothetical protein
MRKYRNYNHEKDYEKVKALCEKHNLEFPHNNKVLIVAETKEGEIVGIGGLRIDAVFNPLISEDNALVANNIARLVEGISMGMGIKILKAEVDANNERHIKHLEKDGFEIVDRNKIILEKKYE